MSRWRAAVGIVVGFGGVAGVLAGVAWLRSESALSRTFELDVSVPGLAADPEAVAHGRHLVEAVLVCGACHGADLGGALLEGHPLVGQVWAPNLTRGAGGRADYTDQDWVRAIRHGVDPQGRGLVWMPSQRWESLGDTDLADVIAWLRVAPSVDREAAEGRLEVGARLMLAMGDGVDAARVDHAAEPADVPWAPTAAYGAYLAEIAGCHDCHGGGRTAARSYGGPMAPPWDDGRLVGWTGAAFSDAVVEGVGRDGQRLHPSMPSAAYRGLNDTEVDALWLHLRPEPSGDGSLGAAR